MPRAPVAGQRVGWLELFFDLVFVVVVAQLTDRVQHEHTALGYASVAALFFAAWASWNNTTLFSNLAGGIPPAYRPLVFVAMAGVGIVAVAIPGIDGPGQVTFAIGYALARTAMWPLWLREQRAVGGSIVRATVFGPVIAALWLASIAVPDPWRLLVWGALLLYDLVPLVFAMPRATHDPVHMLERVGLFVMIVLGESVYELIRELIPHPSPARWLVAALAFAIVCALWWLYFEATARLRDRLEHSVSGVVFRDILVVGHFTLVLGLVFLAAALGSAIEAADDAAARGAIVWPLAIGLALYAAAQFGMALRFGVRTRPTVLKTVPTVVAIVLIVATGPSLPAAALVGIVLADAAIEIALNLALRRVLSPSAARASAPRS